tara:strand:+ start:25366 stop:26775 length:1410 start_codon:yes stop_codon:yes gene_type:complete
MKPPSLPPEPRPGRRSFLRSAGKGLGGIALSAMLGQDAAASERVIQRIKPRAKRVVWLFMHGGPSHLDLWDPKFSLYRYEGQPLPDSYGPVETRRRVAKNPLMAPVRPFQPRGESGLMMSEMLPSMAEVADELCVIKSCHGDSVNHPQAVYQTNTGSMLMGKPSLGSWLSYGLGSENENMPAFVVMPDPGAGPKGGPPAWGNGFLPATHQGVTMRPGNAPILNLNPPKNVSEDRQDATLSLIQQLNLAHLEERHFDDALVARVRAYEMAHGMQSAAPELTDLSDESEGTKQAYGIDIPWSKEFGTRCLLARRMLERGVRFVQLYSGDTVGWDAHSDLKKNHSRMCKATDQPVSALIQDLRQRGLLEDTLVIWGGEFGRMPMSEKQTGRDHNPWGYSTVLAGAGVKGGFSYGSTDEFGLRAQENPVHVHDLHATILHLLGIDHKELTFRHNGKDERLTDIAGNVVTGILS